MVKSRGLTGIIKSAKSECWRCETSVVKALMIEKGYIIHVLKDGDAINT